MDRQPEDQTPTVGAQTDIAPLGRAGTKPLHERTADEERGTIDWNRIAAMEDFKSLLRKKKTFIVSMMIFFIVYYFALPVLVGYAPEFMERKVWGEVNIAYVFALSQFFMAWAVAAIYVRAAGRFDQLAAQVLIDAKRA